MLKLRSNNSAMGSNGAGLDMKTSDCDAIAGDHKTPFFDSPKNGTFDAMRECKCQAGELRWGVGKHRARSRRKSFTACGIATPPTEFRRSRRPDGMVLRSECAIGRSG
jgi:hypothetical protein